MSVQKELPCALTAIPLYGYNLIYLISLQWRDNLVITSFLTLSMTPL